MEEIRGAEMEYSERCVTFCDRAPVCQAKALEAGKGSVLGDDVSRFLGGVGLHRALALMAGKKPATAAERDLQRRIRDVEGLRKLA